MIGTSFNNVTSDCMQNKKFTIYLEQDTVKIKRKA